MSSNPVDDDDIDDDASRLGAYLFCLLSTRTALQLAPDSQPYLRSILSAARCSSLSSSPLVPELGDKVVRDALAWTDASCQGFTSLHFAVWLGQVEEARILVEFGAPVDATDAIGRTPLYRAAEMGHVELVRLLIMNHACVDYAEPHKGWTPLMRASYYGFSEVVDELLQHGANGRIRDFASFTALHWASLRGHGSCVHRLLTTSTSSSIDSSSLKTMGELSPSSSTAELLSPNSLLSQGSNSAHERIGIDFSCPSVVHLACASGSLETVREILYANDFRNEWNEVDDGGNTPLHIACMNGFSEAVSEILNRIETFEFDIDFVNDQGFSPFLVSCAQGDLTCSTLLLEHGANVFLTQSHSGETALQLALDSGNEDVVSLLKPLFEEEFGSEQVDIWMNCAEDPSCGIVSTEGSDELSRPMLLYTVLAEAGKDSFRMLKKRSGTDDSDEERDKKKLQSESSSLDPER